VLFQEDLRWIYQVSCIGGYHTYGGLNEFTLTDLHHNKMTHLKDTNSITVQFRWPRSS